MRSLENWVERKIFLMGDTKPIRPGEELNIENLKISRLAKGLATGGDIEYADESTLSAAMQDYAQEIEDTEYGQTDVETDETENGSYHAYAFPGFIGIRKLTWRAGT